MTLKTARQKREEAKRLLRDGKDPSTPKKVAKLSEAVARGATFGIRADMLIEAKERAGKAERTDGKVRWLLNWARPDIGKGPIGEITSIEILAVIRKLEDKEHLETAKRLRATIGEVFRTVRPPVTVSHAAVTEPKPLGQLLRAIDGFDGQPLEPLQQ